MTVAQPLKRILVVDDEKEVRDALQRILERERFEVESVPDAPAAMALARSRAYDLVITDLVMPGPDGLELLKQLKSCSPEIRVILVTAYGSWESYLDAMNRGASNYLTKPVKKVELLRVVRHVLDLPAVDTNGHSGNNHAASA